MPAGVQLFSLFYHNPPLVALLAEIMGAGPRLADEIARRPGLLDGVLARGLSRSAAAARGAGRGPRAHARPARAITRSCSASRGAGSASASSRSACRSCAAGSTARRRAARFADIAEAAIAALLPRVSAEFAASHGAVPGGAMVVLGLGKLGSREMTVTSDLDLILIYDAPRRGRGVGRRAAAAGLDLLRAALPALHQCAHRAHRRGQSLRGRHAAAAIGHARADRTRASPRSAAITTSWPGPGSRCR